MSAPVDIPRLVRESTRERPLTMFVWEWETESVRAGRRYPAERKADGTYESSELTASQDARGVALEIINHAGQRVALWTARMWTHLNPGDRVRFTITEGP